MYIKEISIDGFKSYAQETTVTQFDPHFNAITGKSIQYNYPKLAMS
jgi:structural maintenance of chromosome 2